MLSVACAFVYVTFVGVLGRQASMVFGVRRESRRDCLITKQCLNRQTMHRNTIIRMPSKITPIRFFLNPIINCVAIVSHLSLEVVLR